MCSTRAPAFTDRAVGGAAVSVEAATLSFDADGSSYENGAFTLPVSVENGRSHPQLA